MRRRGFTLLEVMVALVVTSVVVALAYTTAQAGLDTGDRLTRFREREQSAQLFRATLRDALRHAVRGVRGGPPVFELFAGGGSGDSLVFSTRGLEAPFGATAVWRVSVWSDAAGVHLLGAPGDDASREPIRLRVAAMRSFNLEMLGRGLTARWEREWSDASLTPDAVAFTLAKASGVPNEYDSADRLVVRLGLERAP